MKAVRKGTDAVYAQPYDDAAGLTNCPLGTHYTWEFVNCPEIPSAWKAPAGKTDPGCCPNGNDPPVHPQPKWSREDTVFSSFEAVKGHDGTTPSQWV